MGRTCQSLMVQSRSVTFTIRWRIHISHPCHLKGLDTDYTSQTTRSRHLKRILSTVSTYHKVMSPLHLQGLLHPLHWHLETPTWPIRQGLEVMHITNHHVRTAASLRKKNSMIHGQVSTHGSDRFSLCRSPSLHSKGICEVLNGIIAIISPVAPSKRPSLAKYKNAVEKWRIVHVKRLRDDLT